jgi:hypothetical protein
MADAPIILHGQPKARPNGHDLLSSTSMTRPAPAVAPGVADAIAGAMLLNILTDIATLKSVVLEQASVIKNLLEVARTQVEVNKHQQESNAAQVTCNAETFRLFGTVADLGDRFNQLVAVVGTLDDRLQAIDGKQSITRAKPVAPEGEQKGEPQ